MSSRLLEYEVWNRVHAYGLISSHAEPARLLLMGIELLEMDRPMLARALEPWPMPLRTLDALHLATVEFLRVQGEPVELASLRQPIPCRCARAWNTDRGIVTGVRPPLALTNSGNLFDDLIGASEDRWRAAQFKK